MHPAVLVDALSGLDVEKRRAALDELEAVEREVQYLHSLVVVRHGHVVAEGYWAPFDAATPHMLFSLSKSFTSSARCRADG